MPFPLENAQAERVVLYGSVLLAAAAGDPTAGRGAFLDDPTDTDGLMSISNATEGDFIVVLQDVPANQELDYVSAHIQTQTAEFSLYDVEVGAYTASTKSLTLWVSLKATEAVAAAAQDGDGERLNICVVYSKQANLATE